MPGPCRRRLVAASTEQAKEPDMDTKRSPKPLVLAPLLAALVLAGCASPPAIDQGKLPAPPAAFKEAGGRWTRVAPADAQARGEWWNAFGDPVLDELMARAVASNDRIQVAAARLAQARAVVRSTAADRAPQVGFFAGALRGTQPQTGTLPRTNLSAGANLSYEVDVFGKLARVTDAAELDAQAREALLHSARLLVQADVAQTYFALRALDIDGGIVNDTVAAYRDTLRLTESRFKAGDVSALDVARVRSEAAATESDALAILRQRSQVEHALAVLVGEVASNFSVAPASSPVALPIVPADVPSTVPGIVPPLVIIGSCAPSRPP